MRHSQMVNAARHALSSKIFATVFIQARKTVVWIYFIIIIIIAEFG